MRRTKYFMVLLTILMTFHPVNTQTNQNDYSRLPEAIKTAVARSVASLSLHPIAKVGTFGFSHDHNTDNMLLSRLVFGEIESTLMFYRDIQVITRSDIHWIKEEQKFQMSIEMDNLNERLSRELAKIAGVDYIVVANIYGESFGLRRIQIRILNVENGRVEGSSTQEF